MPDYDSQLPHPGFLIYDTVRLFRRCFGARLQDLGLSEAQWRTLATLRHSEGISQTELAEYLGIGKAPLGSLVDKLERARLLVREPDPADRRLKRLFLTRSAQAVAATIRERYGEFELQFLSGISAHQQRAMGRQLQRIYQNLAGEPGQPLVLMHQLVQIERLFGRHFDNELKQLGFTRSQWLLLAAIYPQQGIAQNELARLLGMQKAPLGALVDDLEQGHWVERRVDPRDRRVRQLYVTDQCMQRWPVLNRAYEAMHRKSMDGISDSQRAQLRKSLDAIRHNLQIIATGT